MNKVAILFLLVFLFAVGCNIINPPEEVPSYLKIDSVNFIEDSYQDIEDVWISLDGNVVGTFELPAIIPVIAHNGQELEIRGGILKNGMLESRIAYPFFKSFTYKPQFKESEVINVIPELEYYNITILWPENFEESGNIIDTTYHSTVPMEFDTQNAKYGNKCGVVHLDEENNFFEGIFSDEFDLPKDGSPVFLELDYKCDNEFSVWLLALTPGGLKQARLLIIKPSDEWNKIYIDASAALPIYQNAIDFTFMIQAVKSNEENTAELFFDNIKVIKFYE